MQRGFIQIPILLLILIGATIVVGGGYFAAKEISKNKIIEVEQNQHEVTDEFTISVTSVPTEESENSRVFEDLKADESFEDSEQNSEYRSAQDQEQVIREAEILRQQAEEKVLDKSLATAKELVEWNRLEVLESGMVEASRFAEEKLNKLQKDQKETEVIEKYDAQEETLAKEEITAKPTTDSIVQYIVRPGDTLSQIAHMFGVSVESILDTNNLRELDVETGITLRIVILSDNERTNVDTDHSATNHFYHVRPGDTLAQIAQMFGVSVESILDANNLSDSNVESGNTLKIIIDN